MKKWVEMFNTLARKEGEKQTKEEEDAAYIDDDDIYEDAVERTGAPCILYPYYFNENSLPVY